MITRRGKSSIVGVDGVVDEEDYNQSDEPDTDDEANHAPAGGTGIPTPVDDRRKRTTLPENIDLPYKRRSHDEGLSYTMKKKKKATDEETPSPTTTKTASRKK
jgi:hypothetical protein